MKTFSYTESEIVKLYKVRLNQAKIKNNFRDYLKDSSHIPKYLNSLMICNNLFQAAQLMRVVRIQLNEQHQLIRTIFIIPQVFTLMFIKMLGPFLWEWNLKPYVTSCLRNHQYNALEKASVKNMYMILFDSLILLFINIIIPHIFLFRISCTIGNIILLL